MYRVNKIDLPSLLPSQIPCHPHLLKLYRNDWALIPNSLRSSDEYVLRLRTLSIHSNPFQHGYNEYDPLSRHQNHELIYYIHLDFLLLQ